MADRKQLARVQAPVQAPLSQRELSAHRNTLLRHTIARMKRDSSATPMFAVTPEMTWSIPTPPPGVVPEKNKLAMDAAIDGYGQWAMNSSLFAEGQAFLGYPYLSELSQRPEYRVISETWAQEMTRKWIRFVSTGDGDIEDKSDKLKSIEAAFTHYKVQAHLKRCVELDGFFGRAQLYIDLGNDTQDSAELKSSIGDGKMRLSRAKIKKGSLKGFRVIEPVWTYPNAYNANNPLSDDFFKPLTWFVMGKEIHHTRLLTFIGRQMPDLLKPMYSFGGLSLSQMAKPYVDNWLRTRQSVSDGISNFSIMILLTDMASMLNDGATLDLETRADFFNVARDNRGLMMADKNSEDLKNVSMPISGLDHLQAQAQEHMCSVSQIPLVKLTGISPSGLNASSEGEIRVFYDKVEASQESFLRDNITTILNIIQLNEFGEVDPEIGFEFEKLYGMDDTEAANVFKTGVDADVALINAGVIWPQEARVRLAADSESPYASLDTSEEALPEPPQQPGQEQDEDGNPMADMLSGGAGTPAGQADAGKPTDEPQKSTQGAVPQGNAQAKIGQRPITSKPVASGQDSLAQDDWTESAHPRGQPHNAGQFAKGSSTSEGQSAATEQSKKDNTSQTHGTSATTKPAEYTAPKKALPDNSPLLVDSRLDQSEAAHNERFEVINNIFKNAKSITDRKPVLYVMGGGGGAGKGTLREILQNKGEIPTEASGAVVIDPDAIKTNLKRYKDIAATGDYRAAMTTHEDSSTLAKEALARAKSGHFDVVFDATMSDFEKGKKRIQEFKDAGYRVNMYNVTVDNPEDAVARAMSRFERTGRYVDPDALREAHQNFNAALDGYEKIADHFETYSNNDRLKLERKGGLPSDTDDNVELTHYSDRSDLTTIDPMAYGSGLKGAEAKRREQDPENWVPRSYHGVGVGTPGGYKKEVGLGNNVYTSTVPASKLYDYAGDPDHLYKDLGMTSGQNSISAYEKAIRDAGYAGYHTNHPSLGKVAATFGPQNVLHHKMAGDENPNHDPKNGEFTTGSNAGEADSFQQRLKELRVPPAWRDVMVNKSPGADLQAIGVDEKGRKQYIYSSEHSVKAAAEKFARLNAFHAAEQHITSTAFSDMQDSKLSPKQRDTAAVLALISQTGFRMGSDADTGAEVQAYGASNMLGSHVQVHGSTLVFNFTGKKGVEQNHTINNVELAQYIGNKKRRVGDGRLFDTTDSNVRGYMKSVGGDDFKVKDYRTYVGTSKALEVISTLPKPATQSQYKKFKNQVGDVVSSVLGNSRAMALGAYINPAVFAIWGFQT